MKNRCLLLNLLSWSILYSFSAFASDILVEASTANWKYLDDGSNQGTAWQDESFDDGGWDTIPYIVNGTPGGVTTYFRYNFTVADPSIYENLSLILYRDDAAVIYLNGNEIYRNNMPAGVISYDTFASTEITPGNEGTPASAVLAASSLQAGNNTIAVEIHQSSADSSDITFILQLVGNLVPTPVGRGPYLQMLTPNSVIIRWGTATESDSHVNFGLTAGNLSSNVTDNTITTTHEIQLTGLTPSTTYYYNVGSTTTVLSSGADHFFKTQPVVGTHPPTRLWVIGDSGLGNQGQRNVYNGYLNFAGSAYTDLWLMLGDNAYQSGTDAEYQAGFFDIYPSLMHQTVVWPTLGNHDGYSVDTPTQTGPYYDIFTLPKAAEAGGVASGTEAYYSYNYGNIHFVVLDSFDVDRSVVGVMATWLEADLSAATADWIITYWHHPPYSKGSHDSDWEIELVEMRENILPILEQHGVDLVLCGHSHNYERSKFVQGHYGASYTYDDLINAIDSGSGDVNTGAQAYSKAHPAILQGGTVYAVAGTSSSVSNDAIDHPVMYRSMNELGSMVIDVNNLALSARFINQYGVVRDEFTIQKLVSGADQDGDDIINTSDNCPQVANQDQLNTDGDLLGNLCDNDDDNDGVPDVIDLLPLDNSEYLDTDLDGIGNNADWDDDGDGVPDTVDADPLNSANKNEITLPLNAIYKGGMLRGAITTD